MHCAACGEETAASDTRYEEVTPLGGGGQTTEEYCSVQCVNEDVGFSDEEIEALMRKASYEPPSDNDVEWEGIVESEISDLHRSNSGQEGEFFFLFCHTKKNYDVEIYHNPPEQIYEVVLYTYDIDEESGEKIGLDEVNKTVTGVFQRAMYYAEQMMESVQDGES